MDRGMHLNLLSLGAGIISPCACRLPFECTPSASLHSPPAHVFALYYAPFSTAHHSAGAPAPLCGKAVQSIRKEHLTRDRNCLDNRAHIYDFLGRSPDHSVG